MKALFTFIKIAPIIILSILFSASAQPYSWHQAPSPNPGQHENFLRGISAVSPNEIWTVGSFRTSPPFVQHVSENLIMKWDGSSWNIYPVNNPGLTMHNLWDVEVVSSNNVWAVGDYAYGPAAKPQLLHWNGTSWFHVNIPNIPNSASLSAIHAISANDIWAVGIRSNVSAGPSLPYALHYDGTSWTDVSAPPVGNSINHFYAIDALNTNDVWAVGYYIESGWGDHRYLAMHWDGTSWTNSPLPAKFDTILAHFEDVVMIAPNNVWALGFVQTGGRTFLHWDGISWTEKTPPAGGLALAATGSNDIYAFGNDIHHWNGNNWTVVDTLPGIDYASLASATILPNGEIWAAGRSGDLAGKFYTLVYRYGPDSTTVGVSNISSINDLNIFPNPVKDELNISFNINSEKEIKFLLLNSSGQIMKEINQFNLNFGYNEFSITTSEIKAGIYYLKIITDDDLTVRRMVKM